MMKLRKFFAALLALTLLLTACGTVGEETHPTQTTPSAHAHDPSKTQASETTQNADTEFTWPSDLTDIDLPITSILLSSANGYSGHGSFIYITPTQIMTGKTTYKNMIKENPLYHTENIEQLRVTVIPQTAFEELCTQLRQMQYNQLPEKIERPEHEAVRDASDFYLAISNIYSFQFSSEGYAATHYHEGFAKIWETVDHCAESLIKQYALPTPTEIKPIESIMLSSSNAYAGRSSFTYLSPTQIANGDMRTTVVIKGNPFENPGAYHMKVADIPAGLFEKICETLWTLRFDLLPPKIVPTDSMRVMDASDCYLIIRFADGTSFTSEGYAATEYNDAYGQIWSYLYRQADALMKQYEAPEKEVKEITAILNYSYNAFAAQNGALGYHCYYYTPRDIVTWQTKNTPVDLTDPLKTENMENPFQTGTRDFHLLIQDLRELKPETLPERIEPDPNNVIFDGDTQCIVIYFADGTTITSTGYCATEYNEQFNAVWDRLRLFRAGEGLP